MCFFMLTGFMLVSEANQAADDIRKSIGASFYCSIFVDEEDDSLWTTVDFGDGNFGRMFLNPVPLTDELAEKIMQVSGVVAYNGSKRGSFFTSLKKKPGFWGYTYEDYLTHPEEYSEKKEDQETVESTLIYKDFAPFIGNTDSSLCSLFRNGSLSLREGRHIQPEDEWKAIISKYVADLNGLHVGDRFESGVKQNYVDYWDVQGGTKPSVRTFGPKEYEIIGIFDVNFKQDTNEYSDDFTMPENFIFTDNESIGEMAEAYGERPDTFADLIFFVEDPRELDSVIEEAEKLDLPWQYLSFKKDDISYRGSIKPLETIAHLGMVLFILVAGCMTIILFFLFNSQIKGRQQEIGIFMALGIPEKKILARLLLEGFIIVFLAFVFACVISSITAQPFGKVIESFTYNENVSETYRVLYNEANIIITEPVGQLKSNLEYSIEFWNIFVTGICTSISVFISIILFFKRVTNKKIMDLMLR